MKKILIVLMVISLALTFSMGAKGCFCKGYDAVMAKLQTAKTDAMNVAALIEMEFPIPAPYPADVQIIFDGAQLVINMCNAAMLKACPVDADVTAINVQVQQTIAKAQAKGLSPQGMKIMTRMKIKYGLK